MILTKRKRIKKGPKIFLVLIIIITIICFIANKKHKEYLYHQTLEYKILEKGYSMEEYTILKDKLDDDKLQNILNRDYNQELINLIKEKYFIYNNLDRYIDYKNKNTDTSINLVISLVNVNRDNDYYSNTTPTNINDSILMLVNKYNYLDENYVPENLLNVSSSYAYADNKVSEVVIEAFKNMYQKAKEEDIQLIINSSYRTYQDQSEIWQGRKQMYGTKKADQYAARAGFSEHQTGLAIDIDQYNYDGDDFTNAPAFTWLANNAYKFGFILRYPEGKEEITGYSYESWHYRYVGTEAAQKIYSEQLTFDEYYAFYIANKN